MASPFNRSSRVFTSADLNRRPNGSLIDGSGAMTASAPSFQGPAVSTVPGVQSARRMPVARSPMPGAAQPNLDGLEGFALENASANAGVYQPGSFGAVNAVANNTGTLYRPPQQTERANPLSGDSNRQLPGSTVSVQRSPFSLRGAGTPSGIDQQDDTIAGSMQGTLGRLRSNFNRPATQASPYPPFLRRAAGV